MIESSKANPTSVCYYYLPRKIPAVYLLLRRGGTSLPLTWCGAKRFPLQVRRHCVCAVLCVCSARPASKSKAPSALVQYDTYKKTLIRLIQFALLRDKKVMRKNILE